MQPRLLLRCDGERPLVPAPPAPGPRHFFRERIGGHGLSAYLSDSAASLVLMTAPLAQHARLAEAEDSWEQKADDIRRLGAGLMVMGSDWTGHFDHLAAHCPVHYLPRTENISSSQLKAEIRRGPPALAADAPPPRLARLARAGQY